MEVTVPIRWMLFHKIASRSSDLQNVVTIMSLLQWLITLDGYNPSPEPSRSGSNRFSIIKFWMFHLLHLQCKLENLCAPPLPPINRIYPLNFVYLVTPSLYLNNISTNPTNPINSAKNLVAKTFTNHLQNCYPCIKAVILLYYLLLR